MIIIKLVFLCILIIKKSHGVKYTIENSTITPDTAVIAIIKKNNCSNSRLDFVLKTHYDLNRNKWTINEPASSCSQQQTSLKDVLSYCQRVYPNLNVINIILEKSGLFWVHSYGEIDDAIEETRFKDTQSLVYKCLYGHYTPVNLYVPATCSFQHFLDSKECQNDLKWIRLINDKCTSIRAYLHDFRLLQWCDAFTGGLSTFTGVEFVCCNLTSSTSKSVEAIQSSSSSNGIINGIEDDNIDYINDDLLATKVIFSTPTLPATSNNKLYETAVITQVKQHSFDSSKDSISHRVVTVMIALMIILTICIILIRKRMYHSGNVDRLMVPMCPNECPEINHINNMQVNGYENPTYKFFETATQS